VFGAFGGGVEESIDDGETGSLIKMDELSV
jgi:hypothetical protein